MAFGSGTLVAVNESHGLVITNYHVVEGASPSAPISVVFPDGFSSAASVLKTDRLWDLAALVIHRPNVGPVPVASHPAQPGELLTIAGYGSGTYRAASGQCTQYVAPAPNQPFEMVELAAAARQGDSGGPILNGRGELAGVLFGTGGGTTAGSYCGRVRWFLASILGDRPRPRDEPLLAGGGLTGGTGSSRPGAAAPASPEGTGLAGAEAPGAAGSASAAPTSGAGGIPPPENRGIGGQWASVATRAPEATVPRDPPLPRPPAAPGGPVAAIPSPLPVPAVAGHGSAAATEAGPPPGGAPFGPGSRFEQIKTVLAGIGLLAILFHGLRMLSLLQAREEGKA
jgi:hypothetical protein